MKQICKIKEPISLSKYRASISKNDLENSKMYESSPKSVLDDLRNYLLEEQGYICCYCMSRIDFNYTKIEHFKPRSIFRVNQLDYSNLFVACCGKNIDKKKFYDCKTTNEKYNKNNFYCDTKKDNGLLKAINLLSHIEKNIDYKKDGLIFSKNRNIDKELNEILNLNYKILQNNRKKALEQLLIELRKKSWTISNLKLNLQKYKHKNSEGKSRPYCEMIVYFLTKKLKSKGITIG